MRVRCLFRNGAPAQAKVSPETQTSLRVSLLLFAAYVFLARIGPELRYTRYMLPAALAALWIARRSQGDKLTLFTGPLSLFGVLTAAIVVWSAVAIGATSSYYPRFFEEALFFAAPLGAAMICVSLRRHDGEGPLYALLAILTIDYVWEVGFSTLAEVVLEPGAFMSELLQSTPPTESVRAFSFGVLTVFFLARRRLGGAALCLLLAFLAGKRIVLIGLLAAVPVALLAPSLESARRRTLVAAVAIALNVVMALSLRDLDGSGIADRIQDMTMQSADAVLMGRARLFSMVADRLPDTPILGAGLGRITHVLAAENAWLTNTHSDVLKHYIELGPVMFAAWIGCFYWASRRRGSLALAVLMNVLFLSDNVSIYFDVMFPFYLSFAYLDRQLGSAPQHVAARRRPLAGISPAPAAA